jgi:hypothetical protein
MAAIRITNAKRKAASRKGHNKFEVALDVIFQPHVFSCSEFGLQCASGGCIPLTRC